MADGGGLEGVNVSDYVSGSRVKFGKVLGTLLSSLFLVAVGGWNAVFMAFVDVHVRAISAFEKVLVNYVSTTLGGSGELLRQSWGEAARAALETAPVLAPILLSLELVLFVAVLRYAGRRSGWS